MLRPGLALLLCGLFHAVAETTTVTLLATTDLHGFLLPWDYLTASPSNRGLAKIATLVAQVRRQNPNTLLIDCGDTIQGSTLEAVHQQAVARGEPQPADPMMAAMNHLRYHAMVLGNHEFNFGLGNLARARQAARFPWLAANVNGFDPYVVATVGAVKVGIVGIITPAVPTWEKPENYRGYRFEEGTAAARRAVADLRQQHNPDVVVVAAHAGLDRDPLTGSPRRQDSPGENMVWQIATQVPGIDAIVFGHTHQELEEHRLGDVLLVQPRHWGMSLARVDFTLERTGGEVAGNAWRILAKRSRLLRVTAETPVDPALVSLAQPYHEAAEQYLNQPVAEATAPMDARLSRVRDTAIIDLIHAVQLHYAKADVSFAASFNPRAALPKGPVTMRQLASLYLYDNTLYALEGDGNMVKDALENAARFFTGCRDENCDGPLIDRAFLPFNYDMAQGVDYEIDLMKPAGQRIQNLRYQGLPLQPDRKLRLAVNNYRAAGSAGYDMFRQAKVVWRSTQTIRDLMAAFYAQRRVLPSTPDGNWRIVPAAAAQRLEQDALADPAALAQ